MNKQERIEAIKAIREFEEDKRTLEEYREEAERYRQYCDEMSRKREERDNDPGEDAEETDEDEHKEMEALGYYLDSKRDEMMGLEYSLEERAREIDVLHYELSMPADPIQEAGRRLVIHAEQIGTTARGLVTELFPYIYAASKRMSTRAISDFLQKEQNVKISPATIARALREPQKHIEAFAETVEPHARNLAEAHGVDILTILKDEKGFYRSTTKDRELLANNSDEQAAVSLQYEESRGFILGTWYTIAPELRAMTCKLIEDQLKEETSEQREE
jgi:hypothetical protein